MDHSLPPNFYSPTRIVKPRSRQYRRLPVISVYGDRTLDEDGQVGNLHDLIADLPHLTPTIFCAVNSPDLLSQFDSIFSSLTDGWQFRVVNNNRDIITPKGVRVATRVTMAITFFGWKNGSYHKLIDPLTMYGHTLDKIWPGERDRLVRLSELGIAIRNFCDENNIEVRPTTGAISSQFLTDPRFYPAARRKVPAAINRAIREELPGNFYHLSAATENTEYTALYIDQAAAHHYHARTTPLPDANHLHAFGRFLDLDAIVYDKIPSHFYGLACVDLERTKPVPFDWFSGPLTKCFVFTNELEHLLDSGYRLQGVRALWGSRMRDTGLPRYAAWATLQLDRYARAAWLKPLLLSTYGTLATRPRYVEAVYKLAKAGAPITVKTGKYSLHGIATTSAKKLEPRIANVLHRGMIEAATRSESVGLAQFLDATGQKILAIYADAVIIELDEEISLPSLPDPWRVKRQLTHLQFIDKQAFISGEMTRLPGTRDLRKFNHRNPAPKLPNVALEMELDETLF